MSIASGLLILCLSEAPTCPLRPRLRKNISSVALPLLSWTTDSRNDRQASLQYGRGRQIDWQRRRGAADDQRTLARGEPKRRRAGGGGAARAATDGRDARVRAKRLARQPRQRRVIYTYLVLTDIGHVADDGVALVNQPGKNARGVCQGRRGRKGEGVESVRAGPAERGAEGRQG